MKKDKPEEFNSEEASKNQIILKYAPVEKPLFFFSDLVYLKNPIYFTKS